jgi:hypothetical protein
MVAHFLKYSYSTKVHVLLLNFYFYLYHWLIDNKVHVLKTTKSILIGAQVEIPNICTFEKNLKMNEKQQCYGLMKI